MKRPFNAFRNAFMAILPMFGRFGATPKTSPESFMPPIEIEGGGPGRAAKRKKNRRYGWKAGIDSSLATTKDRKMDLLSSMRTSDRRTSRIVGSLRGTPELREYRRLRSAGFTRHEIQTSQP